jgi:universal stress protein A
MSNYKNILVAIDINAEHDKVIQKALSICNSVDDLSLVYIPMPLVYIQPYLYGLDYSDINDDDRIESAREKLTVIAKYNGIAADKIHLKTGDAGNEIKQIANEIHADLIVIGTHGKSGLKLLLGSTANSVLHGVKQDVLAVRIHEE